MILYVHASVNLLSSYMPEIASKQLGTSKERVKKIENLLIEMTEWLEKEKSVINTPLDQLFDAPYSLKVKEEESGKQGE